MGDRAEVLSPISSPLSFLQNIFILYPKLTGETAPQAVLEERCAGVFPNMGKQVFQGVSWADPGGNQKQGTGGLGSLICLQES